ncbi:ABC transporter ATP-binding protein [Nocardia farcinica]|uniref:ABC transporter ATP-binding protein n=1 Tax=Nocardia farcinica TaxID=37329 RepID=UPI0024572D28|nr:ABC transporter ATP-binding protein [Nocardia farcinica]
MTTTAPDVGLAAPGALSRLLAPVRTHLLVCAVLSAAGAVCGFLPYLAIAEIARAVLAGGTAESVATVRLWVAVGIAGAAGRMVLLFASSRLGHYADARLLHDLRARMIRHLGALPLGWFSSNGSGRIKKRMTNDLEDMHILIAHALGEIVGAVVAVALGLTYLCSVDWRLTGAAVAALLMLAVSYRVAMRSAGRHTARLIAAEADISAASVEYADGVAVVKTYGAGGRVLDRFDRAVREHSRALAAWAAETKYSSALSRLLSSEMSLLTVLAVAGLALLAAGRMPAADLVPFLVVGIGLPTTINPAIQGSQGLRKGRAAAGNIEGLLRHPPLPEPANPALPDGARIEFDDVHFSYDGRTEVLRGVRAVCEPGTITALVGPSGAGKSTLAALVPRFHDVTGGAVRIGGVDVRDIPTERLLASMALVFQDVVLVRDTVNENIRLGRPEAGRDEVEAAAKAAAIHDVITALPDGYDTVLGEDVELSGGERQRLTIARAILSDAPIVVLDEATAALDPDSETAVQHALSALIAGRTVLVVAHRLHTITEADQILVLDDGRVVERGRHADLLAVNGRYARMWAAQHRAPQD